MRVLISGVAGFLGSHLADHLVGQGHEVIGVDNLVRLRVTLDLEVSMQASRRSPDDGLEIIPYRLVRAL